MNAKIAVPIYKTPQNNPPDGNKDKNDNEWGSDGKDNSNWDNKKSNVWRGVAMWDKKKFNLWRDGNITPKTLGCRLPWMLF